VALDGSDDGAGLALCQQIKQGPAAAGSDAVALVLVTARLRQTERVRAKLAGCDAFLAKPVGRGDVARALEACAVALPSDARKR
jgi:CheY-like chemotaxis protein